MKILRSATLPLLHRGDRLSNSPTVWLSAVVVFAIGGFLAGHAMSLYVLSSICLLGFGFWFMSRLIREMALRSLSDESCPNCEATFDADTASAVFEDYSRNCIQLIQQTKGALSVDLGKPADFVCPSCGAHLFFDYLGSGTVSAVNDDAEGRG